MDIKTAIIHGLDDVLCLRFAGYGPEQVIDLSTLHPLAVSLGKFLDGTHCISLSGESGRYDVDYGANDVLASGHHLIHESCYVIPASGDFVTVVHPQENSPGDSSDKNNRVRDDHGHHHADAQEGIHDDGDGLHLSNPDVKNRNMDEKVSEFRQRNDVSNRKFVAKVPIVQMVGFLSPEERKKRTATVGEPDEE